MKPGVTPQQADADLNGLAARLAKTYPIENENWGTRHALTQPVDAP